jgi:Tfp pilus assembly protein PilF
MKKTNQLRFIYIFLFLLTFFSVSSLLAQNAKIREEVRTLKTYPFSDPDPIPVLSKNPKIYPYHRFDGYSLEGKDQDWKVVVLENEYIEVYVLPQSGGKIWGAIEKSTGEEFLYKNEVMKFRNISMRGPWTSGGIEFNFGIIGHSPATATPVNYLTRSNDDGSVTCVVGNFDVPSRTYWRVAINLPKDKAYFETKVTWYNPTPVHQAYYNWMTGAAATGDDLEFFIPGNQYLTHPGESKSWPMDGDREIFKYKENNYGPSKSYHIVGEYNDFFGGYFHNKRFGFGHWSNYEEMPGQKLWLWALSRSGGIWEDLLTDTDGQYIEFQSGRQFSQYSPGNHQNPVTKVPFQPNATDIWSELWFPVKEIGGLTEVSPQGVLHVTKEGNELTIGVNALAKSIGTLKVTADGDVLLEEKLSMNPMDVLSKKVTIPSQGLVKIDIDEMDLHFSSDPKANLIKRPFESDANFSFNDPTYRYHQGFELMEDRAYEKAKEVFNKVLKADPFHQLTLLALAEMDYRSALYDNAIGYVNRVLKQDTYHPRANFQAGIVYRAMNDNINALESLGWAARSLEFRSAAYAQMAEVYISQNENSKALQYVEKSLDFNRFNINALQAGIIAGRLVAKSEPVEKYSKQLYEIDPLNHFARFEGYLRSQSEESKKNFISGFQNELPEQNILEIGIHYANLSLNNESALAFELIPNNVLAIIWLAYLQPQNTKNYLQEASLKNSEYVFPYRRETIAVLESAVENKSLWKFNYYLALNYWAKGRLTEANELMRACGQEPDHFAFYLARADLRKKLNNEEGLRELTRANQMAPYEWRIDDRLIAYYLEKREDEKALKVSSMAIKKYPGNNSIQLKHVQALLQSGQGKNALKIMKTVNILPFEGASEGRSFYENAHLMVAMNLMKSKKYDKSIELLKEAQKWPESMGVGKPYDPDHRAIDFLMAEAYQRKGNKKQANQIYQRILDYGNSTPSSMTALFELMSAKTLKDEDRLSSLINELREDKGEVSKWVLSLYNGQKSEGIPVGGNSLKTKLFNSYFSKEKSSD